MPVYVKKGDRFPDVEVTVTDENGNPVVVTGATIKFSMRKARDPATVPINELTGSVVDGPNGKIKYEWAAGQTDSPGVYEGEFLVTPTVGDPFSVPTDGFITIIIGEAIP